MAIAIPAPMFLVLYRRLLDTEVPTPAEVAAITQLGELVSSSDLDEDIEETVLRDALTQYLCRLSGIDPARVPLLPRLPIDSFERVPIARRLAGYLHTRALRELAYVFAYLMLVSDFEVAPVENEALADVRDALGLDERRATELADWVGDLVTPRDDQVWAR